MVTTGVVPPTLVISCHQSRLGRAAHLRVLPDHQHTLTTHTGHTHTHTGHTHSGQQAAGVTPPHTHSVTLNTCRQHPSVAAMTLGAGHNTQPGQQHLRRGDTDTLPAT